MVPALPNLLRAVLLFALVVFQPVYSSTFLFCFSVSGLPFVTTSTDIISATAEASPATYPAIFPYQFALTITLTVLEDYSSIFPTGGFFFPLPLWTLLIVVTMFRFSPKGVFGINSGSVLLPVTTTINGMSGTTSLNGTENENTTTSVIWKKPIPLSKGSVSIIKVSVFCAVFVLFSSKKYASLPVV